MEEKRELLSKEFKENIIRLMPLIISIIVILFTGLSFIGSFYTLKIKIDGVKSYQDYSFATLLFNNPAGTNVQVFYLIIYLVFPLIACISLFLKRFSKYFQVVSLLLFLGSGITSIVAKEVFLSVYSSLVEGSVSIDAVHFFGVLPIITYFVSFVLTLSTAINEISFDVRDITEMGIFVAIAFGLSFIKFYSMPTGGSINLQMLPLYILALRRGPLKGFIGCGIVYGLICCFTDGYGVATFPFDYLVGFGSACIFGFFANLILNDKKSYNVKGEIFILVAGIIATLVRYVGGCVSSMVLYNTSFSGALVYNLPYILPSCGVAVVSLMVLYGPLLRVHHYFPTSKKEELPEE